jgi:hypothetical protein
MTPIEFYNWIRGYYETEFERYKREAELHRILTLRVVNTQMGKNQIHDPKKLIKFAWEVQKAIKLTPEQVDYLKTW